MKQGPAYQSRPTFKLFHQDFASSGIWTVGTSPFSDRLVRTRKALATQIAPRLLPIYTPVIHPKLKKLIGDILTLSQGNAVDMAEKLHRFGTGQVSEQLMGTPLDDDIVGMLAENETNICKFSWVYSYALLFSPSSFLSCFQYSHLLTVRLSSPAYCGFTSS